MNIFCLDSNFVLPRMVHERRNVFETPNQLDRLVFLKEKRKIEICFPTTTQAEIYSVLKAKGISFKNKITGKRENKLLSHHQIMKLARNYEEIFDLDYLNGYKNIDFPPDNYKEVLFENIRLELNMTIQQSKEFIENKTGQSIDHLKDEYDYHVMASALKCNADFLISENTGDLLNPLGKCQIITIKELPKYLPIYP